MRLASGCRRAAFWVALVLSGAATAACAARREKAAPEGMVFTPTSLYEAATAEMAAGKLRQARTHLERIQLLPEDRTAIEPLVRLALADLAFFTNDDLSLIDARAKYLDFVELYPNHPRAPYALLQAGMASFNQVGSASRDQSQTRVAIADLREVERKYPDSPYVRVAREFVARADGYLAEHDFLVARFYLRKKAYLATVDRLRSLLATYPTYPDKGKVYFYMSQGMLGLNNDTEARILLDKIVADYPGTEYAKEATKLLARESGKQNRKG